MAHRPINLHTFLGCCLLLISFSNLAYGVGNITTSTSNVTVEVSDIAAASFLKPLMTPFPDDSPEMQTISPPAHIFDSSSSNIEHQKQSESEFNRNRTGKYQSSTDQPPLTHFNPAIFDLSPIRVSIPTSSSSATTNSESSSTFSNSTNDSVTYYPSSSNATSTTSNFRYEYEPAASAANNAVEMDNSVTESAQSSKKFSSSASNVPSSTYRGGPSSSSSSVPREEARATVFDVVGDSSLFSTSPSLTPKSSSPLPQSTAYLPIIKPNVPFITVFDVKCEKKGMQVHVEFDRPFHGIIYSKGHFQTQECNYVFGNSGSKSFDFHISFEYCGTVGEDPLLYGDDSSHDTFYENTIILQFDPHIIEVWDLAKRLRCEWKSQYEKSVFVRPFQVATLDPEVYKYNGDDIEAWMQINRGKGPYGEEVYGVVKIGEPLTIVIGVNDHEKNFDMQVKDCFATDGYGRKVQLTDYYGCVVREKIMNPFSKIKNAGPQASVLAYANFQAFKFPDRMEVGIKCNIQICRHHCADGCPKYAAALEVSKLTGAGSPIPTSVAHPMHHHLGGKYGDEQFEEGSQQKTTVVRIGERPYEPSSSATSAATLQAKSASRVISSNSGDSNNIGKKSTTIDVKVASAPGYSYESPPQRTSSAGGSSVSITSYGGGSGVNNMLTQRRPIVLHTLRGTLVYFSTPKAATRPKFDKVPPPSYILQDPYKLPAYTSNFNSNNDDFDPEPPSPPKPPSGPPLPPFPPGAPPSIENNNNGNMNNNNNNFNDPFGAFANQRIIGVSEPPPFQFPQQQQSPSSSSISLQNGNSMTNINVQSHPNNQQQQQMLPKLEAYKRRRRELEEALHGHDTFLIAAESVMRASNSTKRGGRQARILDVEKPEFGMNAVIRVISPSDLQYDVLPATISQAGAKNHSPNRNFAHSRTASISSKSSNAVCIGVTTFSVILSTLFILLSLTTTVATFLCLRFRRKSASRSLDHSSKDNHNASSVSGWCQLLGNRDDNKKHIQSAGKPCKFVFVPMPSGGTTTAPVVEMNNSANTYRSAHSNILSDGGTHRAQPIITASSPPTVSMHSTGTMFPSPPSTAFLSSYMDNDAKSCSSS